VAALQDAGRTEEAIAGGLAAARRAVPAGGRGRAGSIAAGMWQALPNSRHTEMGGSASF
jgi:hypothetical protein